MGEIKSLIKVMLNLPPEKQVPIFLWGPPGVGKSSSVRQVSEEVRIDFLDLRLGLLEPVDFRGVPYLKNNGDGEETFWARPSILPREGRGIFFLDEFNVAVPAVQTLGYQLVQDRRVGEHKIGDGWYIIGAGNRETDAAVVYRMPSPLRSRFIHIDFEVNVDDWIQWAVQNNVHDAVIGYVSYRGLDGLIGFDPKSPERTFRCPRTWEYTSRLIQAGQDSYEVIAGTIGAGSATEFLAFYKLRTKLPDVSGILEGSIKTLPEYDEKEKPSIIHFIISTLISRISVIKRDRISAIDNVLKFSMDNFSPEFNVLTMTRLKLVAKSDIPKCSMFPEFIKKYKEVVL